MTQDAAELKAKRRPVRNVRYSVLVNCARTQFDAGFGEVGSFSRIGLGQTLPRWRSRPKTANGVSWIRRSRCNERRRCRTTRSPEPTRPPIAHSFSDHGAEPESRARSAERSEGTLDAGEHRGLLKGRWSTVLEAPRSGSFQVYLARLRAVGVVLIAHGHGHGHGHDSRRTLPTRKDAWAIYQ